VYTKPKYKESDLLDYLTDMMDQFMDDDPDGLVICGGDLNHLNLDLMTSLTGLEPQVDFPTRGNAVLDNCLVNHPRLFSKCYPFVPQVKTDHKGVILPAGVKLKPLKFKYSMRDYREHRKISFHKELIATDWNSIVNINSRNIDDVVNNLNVKIHQLINKCFPVKTVVMSSRDPPWISPLVKLLLRKKAKLQANGKPLSEIKSRIANIIKENRDTMRSHNPMGSGMWWKTVDSLSHRKDCSQSTLSGDFTRNLNDFFGNICHDSAYVEPCPMSMPSDTVIPHAAYS
jgi:hypothetical protein